MASSELQFFAVQEAFRLNVLELHALAKQDCFAKGRSTSQEYAECYSTRAKDIKKLEQRGVIALLHLEHNGLSGLPSVSEHLDQLFK